MKELNVIGTMQLLAACQQAPDVRKLVVKSSAAVYGASNRDPAMFTEGMNAKRLPSSGFAKDITEVESYTRGFARRRPDVAVTTLRIANVIGPRITSAMTGYFRLPVIPTVLGFNPRLQFVHEQDALDVLEHATVSEVDRHLQHRRRRRHHPAPRPYAASAGPRSRCPASPCPASAPRSGRPGSPTSRPSRWPS